MNEKMIYEGSPSQLTNFGYYMLCLILAPIGVGVIMFLVRYLQTKFTTYTITDETITNRTGILSRTTNETELYRVKDIKLDEPILLRLFGLSTITLITSDKNTPTIILYAVKEGESLRKKIRLVVEARRDAKGVVERDFV